VKFLSLTFALIIVFVSSQNSKAFSPGGGCLKLPFPNHYYDSLHLATYANGDSVLVDSCMGSPTYLEYYATKLWVINFAYYVISRSPAPYDTTVELSWSAINTAYSALRSAFAALESKYGTFHLKEIYPNIIDSTVTGSNWYSLRFDNYVCVDSIDADLVTFPDLDSLSNGHPDAYFNSFPRWMEGIPNERSLVPGVITTALSPDPDPFFPSMWYTYLSYWHSRGWGWSIYSLHCPLAWEITMGKSNVVIADHDDWSGNAEVYSHPDILYRTSSAPNGNWMVLNSNAPVGDPQYYGDGRILSTFELGTAHGSTVLPLAIALVNNDNLSTPPSGALAGVAPKCLGIALDGGQGGNNPNMDLLGIDVDGLAKNGTGGSKLITHPDVYNYSYLWEPYWNLVKDVDNPIYESVIDAGSVEVASGGNTRVNSPNPGSAHPSACVYPDPNNPSDGTKDVKVIAVGALDDGPLQDCPGPDPDWVDSHGNEVPSGTPGAVHPIRRHPHYTSGFEWFTSDWNYSHGTDKFNNSTDPNTRISAKEDAHIDVVAPSHSVMVLETSDDRMYNPNESGTSQGSPEVAGVVGLMMSIQKGLGETGRNVQRKAYDILTFTADKVRDINNITAGLPEPSTFDYTLETNDPLHRSWEQRMGFGKVNAYRAVANSIPCIGNYSYATSGNLDFSINSTQNENTQYLMHFGAYKDSLNLTLNVGGNQIPNQAPTWAHYNQGQTKLYGNTSTPTVLTVPTNSILVIDGILWGDGTSNNKITSAGTTGKILVTGYLQDVEVTGDTVKADDLIVYSDPTKTGRVSQITVSTNQISEIYGVVQLQGKGNFVVNGGKLTVQPGGEIEMEGNNDFEIQSGSIVTMQASSQIVSSSRKVIVDNGAQLIISGLLPVNVLCMLDVKSGGIVTINPGANLQVDQFLVEAGGTLICQPGGRMTLNKHLINYCYGNFTFNGTPSDSCMLTAGVSTCGTVDDIASVWVVGNTGSMPLINQTSLTMAYTDDSDVGITAKNTRKAVFDHDHYSLNSSFNHPTTGNLSSLGVMLVISNTTTALPIFVPTTVSNAIVSNCHFFDEEGASPESQVPTWNHNCNGLSFLNMKNAKIFNSSFYNIFYGVETQGCPNVLYETDTFGFYPDGVPGPVSCAIMDNTSGVTYCSNIIGHSSSGALKMVGVPLGALHDNRFTNDSAYSITAQAASTADLRNDTFYFYAGPPNFPPSVNYGAWSAGKGCVITLTDAGTTEYGKNIFDPGAPVGNASYDLVRGINSIYPLPTHGGDIKVGCGWNSFSKNSKFHIANLDPGPAYPIAVQYNYWHNEPGSPKVRVNTPQVIPSGVPLNASTTVSPFCGNVTDFSPTCTIISPTRASNETWLTMLPTDPALKVAFASASGTLLSDTNDVLTRRYAAQDEMWSAALMDSSASYLPMALNDFETVTHSLTAPLEVKGDVWQLEGNLFEMIGNLDSAVFAFDTVLTSYHQFSDSVYAQWGIQRDTLPIDTVTATSDSLRIAYDLRVQNDIIAMMDTVSSADTDGGAHKIADGNQSPVSNSEGLVVTVHPNPASSSVKVCVEDLPGGIPVTVEVVNQLGETVAMLYNATPEAELGLCLSLDCSKLPNGSYYADLRTDGTHKAVKFSIEH
jgi:hypothetical protein